MVDRDRAVSMIMLMTCALLNLFVLLLKKYTGRTNTTKRISSDLEDRSTKNRKVMSRRVYRSHLIRRGPAVKLYNSSMPRAKMVYHA
jgi:hypothetical protein